MAQQTFTIAAFQASLANTVGEQFDADLVDGGGTAFFVLIAILNDVIAMPVRAAADGTGGTVDLTTQWENAPRALTLTDSDGNSVVVPGPNHSSNTDRDDSADYNWLPANHTDVTEWQTGAQGKRVEILFSDVTPLRLRASMLPGVPTMTARIQHNLGKRVQAVMSSGVPTMRARILSAQIGRVVGTMRSGVPTMTADMGIERPFDDILPAVPAGSARITLDICNGALTLVGTQLLPNLQEDNAQGYACRAFFDTAFSRTLTRVPWLFARKNVELEESEDEDTLTQTMRGSHLYRKPADFERMWTWRGGITPDDARVEGTHIRSYHNPPMPLTYIRRATVDEVPQTFIEIVQVILAESIKPRFSKGQVSADALSQRELSAKSMELIREASAIELSQISQPESVGAEQVGRGYGSFTRSRWDW